jgi:hypothetical protein
VDDIKRKLSDMVNACSLTYLVWRIEQGFLLLPVVRSSWSSSPRRSCSSLWGRQAIAKSHYGAALAHIVGLT